MKDRKSRISEQLDECQKGLVRFNSRTEPAFLHLGKELESLYPRAQLLAGFAKSATELEAEKSLPDLISELKSLVEKSSGILGSTISASKGMVSQITEIGAQFKHISCKHRALEKLSFVTKMLGISSRIQASRLGKIGEEFQFVSEQVSSFSRTLYIYSSELKAEIDQSTHKITGIENSIITRLDEQKRRHDLTSQEMSFTLETLTDVSEKAAGMSAEINNFSGNVFEEIGIIISAVQFQDITRQQIEHINDSLAEIKTLLCPSEKRNVIDDSRAVYTNLLVQISQLNDIRDKISEAGSNICEALAELDKLIAKHAYSLENFAGSKNASGQDSFAVLNNLLDDLGKQLHSSFTLGEELFMATKGVSGLVDRVGNNRDKIDGVCMDMKILSINASAQAAPLGSEGARLSVISGGLKELADSWSTRAGELVAGIQDAVLLAKNLEADLFKMLKETQEEAQKSHVSCSSSLDVLKNAHCKIVSNLSAASGLSNSLKRQIETILDGLFFRDADIELGNLLKNLEKVKNLIGEEYSISEADLPSSETAGDNLNRYTMECERLNHMRALGKKESAEVEADWGANVELF